ncbi:MAG: TatD family hydrolase [Pseudomonadota bacterium]
MSEPTGQHGAEETARLRLVDSHCHLDFPELVAELDAVIARAAAAGVTRMVTICTRLAAEPSVRAIAERHAGVFYAAGTHPMKAADAPMATVEELVALAAHPKFVGIGETGLDYHYTAESAARQQESLRLHIEAARRTGLPLIIHARDADEDMARILSEEHTAGRYACVMHCFSSGAALAETALGLGFYLSMSGIAAFKNSGPLRDIFAAAPRDRLLVETDSPYLAPPPHRGRRCEPAYTALTLRAVAEAWGEDPAALAAQTTANFDRLFSKAAAHGEEAAA